MLKSGTPVSWNAPPPAGVVVKAQIDEKTEAVRYLVAYVGADGENHQRWMAEGDLQELTGEDAAAIKALLDPHVEFLRTPELPAAEQEGVQS